MQNLKISIFGKNYLISTDESSEDIVAAAQVVDDLMRKKGEYASLQSETQLAIIASLELATDLVKKRQQLEQLEVKIAALNRAVESSL